MFFFITETKEKSAFEKLTDDLKRSFGGKRTKSLLNSADSSSCSMYSPPMMDKSTGGQLSPRIGTRENSISKDNSSVDVNGRTNPSSKHDSTWALTATTSIRRKSFTKPTYMEKTTRQKRLASSFRDCRSNSFRKMDEGEKQSSSAKLTGEVVIDEPSETRMIRGACEDAAKTYTSQVSSRNFFVE